MNAVEEKKKKKQQLSNANKQKICKVAKKIKKNWMKKNLVAKIHKLKVLIVLHTIMIQVVPEFNNSKLNSQVDQSRSAVA